MKLYSYLFSNFPTDFPKFFDRRSYLPKIMVVGTTLFVVSFGASATAKGSLKPSMTKIVGSNPISDVSTIAASQYELALAQVLSEICPSMLNQREQAQFNQAYQNQLRVFMPTANNPSETMRYLSNQRDYRAVLQNVRSWTTRYSASENKELCQEFAQIDSF